MPEEGEWVMGAFNALSPSRPITMGGIGRIPFEAVDAYARRYGIEGSEDFEEFHVLLSAVDAAYVDAVNDRKGETETEQ